MAAASQDGCWRAKDARFSVIPSAMHASAWSPLTSSDALLARAVSSARRASTRTGCQSLARRASRRVGAITQSRAAGRQRFDLSSLCASREEFERPSHQPSNSLFLAEVHEVRFRASRSRPSWIVSELLRHDA